MVVNTGSDVGDDAVVDVDVDVADVAVVEAVVMSVVAILVDCRVLTIFLLLVSIFSLEVVGNTGSVEGDVDTGDDGGVVAAIITFEGGCLSKFYKTAHK